MSTELFRATSSGPGMTAKLAGWIAHLSNFAKREVRGGSMAPYAPELRVSRSSRGGSEAGFTLIKKQEKNGKFFSCQSGFTLLEVMIAMAIMVVAFASILMVQSGSVSNSIKARQLNVVAMLARNAMIEAEMEIEGKPFTEVAKSAGEAFEEPYQDYRWTREIKEIKFPNLVATGGGGEGSEPSESGKSDAAQMMGKLVTNFFNKAVREVTVTVYYKRGSGEQSFSLSTYWVDLNHEFSLSE